MAKKTQLYQLPKSFKKGGYLYAKRYKSPLFYDDAKKRATQLKARGKKVIIKSAYETGKIFWENRRENFCPFRKGECQVWRSLCWKENKEITIKKGDMKKK